MKKIHCMLMLLCLTTYGFAQQEKQLFKLVDSITTEKTNPIIFADIYVGYSVGSSNGMTGSASLNYQRKNDLFTFRFSELSRYKTEFTTVLPIPIFELRESIDEYALLYGKRYVQENKAYSFSVGAAFVQRKHRVFTADDAFNVQKDAFGVPFEASVKWFKRRRAPYRIYGLIPVGGPVAFGNSFGFKLLGNVSRTTFVGVGITVGVGFHKHY